MTNSRAEYYKKYYEEHKEQKREYNRKYREEHKEEIREQRSIMMKHIKDKILIILTRRKIHVCLVESMPGI